MMNLKKKASCIFFAAVAMILFLTISAAFSDAPGVRDPGKRVPARTAKPAAVKKKAATVKKTSKPKRAEQPAQTAQPTQPTQPAPVYTEKIDPLMKAVYFIKQEKYKKALPYVLSAIKEQPINADVWYWFGIWSDRTGNFGNAQKYFTKALDIDPNYPALTRIVVYPGDPYAKNPLWDSVRPPSIETIYPLDYISAAEYDELDSPKEFNNYEIPIYLPPDPK